MRKLFVLLVIAGLVIGFGFYRGWFRADKSRIKEDGHTAIVEASEVGSRVSEGVQEGVHKLTEGTQK